MNDVAAWRITTAQRLLRRGAAMKQVAGDVGFATVSAFSKAFARLAGVPPSIWMANLRHPIPPHNETIGQPPAPADPQHAGTFIGSGPLMPHLHSGDHIDALQLTAISGQTIDVPHPQALTHLQFRRFAGCPMCNLHIHSFVCRHAELQQAGIQEVAVFHSSTADLLAQHAQAPFALIADPHKALYRQYGVEAAWRSVMDPWSWWAAVRGLLKHGVGLPGKGESMLGLPADLLIAPDGRVLAAHYGRHADDQWSMDELLALAKEHRPGEV